MKKYLLIPGFEQREGARVWVGILDLLARHGLDSRECVGINGALYCEMLAKDEIRVLKIITPTMPFAPSRAPGRYAKRAAKIMQESACISCQNGAGPNGCTDCLGTGRNPEYRWE